jgi:hypothetical protein
MAVPDFQTLLLPLLKFAGDSKEHTVAEAIDCLGREFQLTPEERKELLPSGKQPRFDNRVGWAVTYLKKGGLITRAGVGRFLIAERGKEVLKAPPPRIDVPFLKARFPEVADFHGGSSREGADEGPAVFDVDRGAWPVREAGVRRIRQKVERLLRDEQARAGALQLLAYAIENADDERPSGWCLHERSSGLALMTGRQLACGIARTKVRVSVIGPVSDETRALLGAEPEDDFEFKLIPGAVNLTFPAELAPKAMELLKEGLNDFVDATMARLRRAVTFEHHVPEAVAYVSASVGRDLPQPEPELNAVEDDVGDDADTEEEARASREPKVRGRAPIFEHGQRSIASLMGDIERDVIALPDLQRPFVWEDTKIRDLLDSLFLGFPVGTLVLWHTANEREARAFGADRPGLRATTLVIDGQQRLTSLYAVMRGIEVTAKDGEKRRITIAFRPRDGRFEVSDAAIRNDPEFIPNVTELWNGARPKSQMRRELIDALRDSGRVVTAAYEDAVERNLEVAHAISDYRFPTVDIRKTSAARGEEASEEDVSEIFVRINNQGKRLGQADFVLTLLSVFHGTLRDRIEERARAMSEGAVVTVDTQQLLRVTCGVAFGRARMSAVYRFLRGVDATSGDSDPASRSRRLDLLDEAAKKCMETTPWRDFLLRVRHAGFVSSALIPSKNAIVNAYTFYVRGRAVGVPKQRLDELIARWVFGTMLTARYSTSSESVFEEDLQRVVGLQEGDVEQFLKALDGALSERLTGDYWTHTLVSELETQKSRAPSALAFRAAQVVLGARALFSDQLLQNLLDMNVEAGRSAREGHHLFPQDWLQSRGIRDRRVINQVANLADAGWYENGVAGAQSPEKYVPRLRDKLGIGDDDWGRLCAEHALPLGWEKMDYADFLPVRRRRMAEIIRVAYGKLGGDSDTEALTPPWFLPGSDLVWQRIAETERALRAVVREVYGAMFGENAAKKIEETLPDSERSSLTRALRARPAAADPLTVVDYLYLAQLPPLLFANEVWQRARERFGGAPDTKQRLQTAIGQITPVRNEIAHVREVPQDRLQRANLACGDVLRMLGLPR